MPWEHEQTSMEAPRLRSAHRQVARKLIEVASAIRFPSASLPGRVQCARLGEKSGQVAWHMFCLHTPARQRWFRAAVSGSWVLSKVLATGGDDKRVNIWKASIPLNVSGFSGSALCGSEGIAEAQLCCAMPCEVGKPNAMMSLTGHTSSVEFSGKNSQF